MASPWYAAELLRRARALYDAPGNPLAGAASSAWRTVFASGADWMRLALESLRGRATAGSDWNFNALGMIKYGLATLAALACVAVAWHWSNAWLFLLVAPAFYAVEAQMVFLFPLALDGSAAPFADARRWTLRAGGTVAVMATVLPLAAVMLLGGWLGRGFVRCWCLGCLAVCLWYEDLRVADGAAPRSE